MIANKKVLVISFSYLNRDPRVNRQIRHLKSRYNVVCAGAGHPMIDGVEYIQVDWSEPSTTQKKRDRKNLLLRHYEDYYWQYPYVADAAEKLSQVDADLILANDIDSLPLALRIAGGTPVIFDAHEFGPLEFADLPWFWALHRAYRQYLCRTYLRRANHIFTVCDGIATRYEMEFGVRPTVLVNAPPHEDLLPYDDPHHDGKIRLVHHGGAIESRKMHLTIEMMRHLDERFELYFMLVDSNPAYLERLKDLASRVGRTYFLPLVDMPDLAKATNQFDVGVFLLPPVNFNYRHALPNKLFEYIQARLAIAIGPSPEMAAIVDQHDLGVVAHRFDPWCLARKLNKLRYSDIQKFKQNAHNVARQYSGDTTGKLLLNTVDQVLASCRGTP